MQELPHQVPQGNRTMEEKMKYEIEFGKSFRMELDWKHLHIIYAVMVLIAKFTPQDDEFHKYVKQVEQILKRKIMFEEEAKKFRLCAKCFKEIDITKDKYKHTMFESGYEVWQHDLCPSINTNKGYEQ